MPEKLQQAIACIKTGEKQRGKRLLAEVLIQDPGLEAAWLLMAEIVDYDEHRRYCLEQVLRLNPSNQFARDRLAALQQDHVSHDAPEQPSLAGAPSPEGQVEGEEPGATAAHRAGVSAEVPVQKPGSSRRRERAPRKSPVLIVVAALIIVGGVTLFFLSAPTILAFSLDPQARLLDAPDIFPNLLLMVLGAALTIAGLAGIWWALWPSGERSPASQRQRALGRRRQEPRSDLLDAGLWLDTGNVEEQETGIRLL
jgi:hypothetical protein